MSGRKMKHIFLIPLSVNALSGRTWRQKAESRKKGKKTRQ
jgi:hypothetical protein